MSAAVATFLVYSSVAFGAVLGKITLNESLEFGKLISITMTLSGAFLVSISAEAASLEHTGLGLFIGLCSGFCFALYTIFGKSARKSDLNSWTIILYSFSISALFLFGANGTISLLQGDISQLSSSYLSLGMSYTGWTVLFFLAIGPTLVGFGLYTISLGYLQSSIVNIIATMEMPIAAIFAFILLNERLSGYQICGSGLIITAVIVLKMYPKLQVIGIAKRKTQKV